MGNYMQIRVNKFFVDIQNSDTPNDKFRQIKDLYNNLKSGLHVLQVQTICLKIPDPLLVCDSYNIRLPS